jgi:hypothetical protein
MKNVQFLMIAFIAIMNSTTAQSQHKMLALRKQTLKDNIAGGWAGKMIGVTYGAPLEFKAQGKTFDDSINWTTKDIAGSIWQDDISLVGNWVKDGGKAAIYVDGKLHRNIDTYYNYSNQEHRNISIWHVFQLKPGKHVVKIAVKGDKNIAASNTNIYITGATMYKTAAKKSELYKISFEQ